LVIVFIFISFHHSCPENRGAKFPKKFLGCANEPSLAVTLREAGQVELRGETPNGLSAIWRLSITGKNVKPKNSPN